MHDTLRRFAAGAAHLALSAGLLWMGHGLAQAQPHNSPSATAAKSAAPTTAASAAALYGQHCASCHGAQRTGGMGPALLPESLARLRRPEALKVIQQGRAATQMGGFAATIDCRCPSVVSDDRYLAGATVIDGEAGAGVS